MFSNVETAFQQIQNKICSQLATVTEQNFKEDSWNYDKGSGGGITRIFSGAILEKAGVNFSSITGTITKKIATKLGISQTKNNQFKASGVSLVLHPYNPFIPTVHLNIRYFELDEQNWFGGGMDLTPYYPIDEDIISFHTELKKICDTFDKDYYHKFKIACDNYFYLPHRQETRGVGGIFFDHLQQSFSFDFVKLLGNSFENSYLTILKKRLHYPFRTLNREFQAHRRSRYVEFNLLYDQGTSFGLETGGRVESIFISMPPEARWIYNFKAPANSEEARIKNYLKPRNWLT